MSGFIDNSAKTTKSKAKKPEFRVNSCQIFITYSQCTKSPEEVLKFLETKFKLEKYIVAQENHKDGNKHIHAYILLPNESKPDIRDPRFLDFDGFHPNFTGCRSWKNVVKYVTKDGNYLTNFEAEVIRKLILDNTKAGELHLQARDLARDGKVEDGLKLLENIKTARDLSMHGDAIERNLRALKRQKTEPKFSLDLFKVSFEWDKTKTLVLWGPTNTGKTSLAKALLPNALFVRHIDVLKEYKTGLYSGIIFDDMEFKHWPRGPQIHLVDTDNVSQINVKHSCAIIPEGTPRIITTNLMPGEVFTLNLMDVDACPISRRLQCEWIERRVW